MQEDEVKDVLRRFFESQAVKLKQEVKIGKSYIDFLIEKDGIIMGIEAKSDNASEFTALGQLLNYYKHLSHVFLAAPWPFLAKFTTLFKENNELGEILDKIGIIRIHKNEAIIQKEAKNSKYYFIPQSETVNRERKPLKSKFIELDMIDEKIIELVRTNRVPILQDMSKTLGMKSETLRKRIRNLEQYGYVRIISKTPTIITLVGDKN